MIRYDELKEGDQLRIVEQGAPGFAKLGDIVTVKSTDGKQRVDVIHDEHGTEAYFALTCGAARLEKVKEPTDA